MWEYVRGSLSSTGLIAFIVMIFRATGVGGGIFNISRSASIGVTIGSRFTVVFVGVITGEGISSSTCVILGMLSVGSLLMIGVSFVRSNVTLSVFADSKWFTREPMVSNFSDRDPSRFSSRDRESTTLEVGLLDRDGDPGGEGFLSTPAYVIGSTSASGGLVETRSPEPAAKDGFSWGATPPGLAGIFPKGVE